MKKIGLNIFPLERKNWSGIEIYTYELMKYLNSNKININTYSLTRINGEEEINKTNYFTLDKINPSLFLKFYYNVYGIKNQAKGLDIFHSTNFILPYRLKAKKRIITVHDLAFCKHPEFFDFKTRVFYKLSLEYSIRQADRIICISESCLSDLYYYFPSSAIKSKCRLIYNGFNNFDVDTVTEINKYGNYLLCVGASHKRKNLDRILKAFFILKKDISDLKLIITGNASLDELSDYHYANDVLHLKYVSQTELIQLYKNAIILMYPSLYEGFGFPILEAMSLGTPVLTSFNSSCKEISGYEDRFLADPYSVDDIVNKTRLILQPCNIKFLKDFGKKKVLNFSWNKMGRETLELYYD